MKNSKKRYLSNIVIAITLVMSAFIMCSAYDNIEYIANKDGYNVFESKEFSNDIYRVNNILYYNLKKSEADYDLTPSDIFLDLSKIPTKEEKEKLQKSLNQFDIEVEKDEKRLENALRNLEYYVINKNSKASDTNSKNQLWDLINEDNKDSVQKLNEIYDFYVVIDYDERGWMSIKAIHGSNKDKLTYELTQLENQAIYSSSVYSQYIATDPIKDTTYVYALPNELEYIDSISSYVKGEKIWAYRIACSSFINVAMIMILALSLIIPYKYSKELICFDKIYKIPFELNIAIVSLGVMFIMLAPQHLIMQSVGGKLEWYFGVSIKGISLETRTIYILNLIYWTICFTAIFIGGVLLKAIWNTGVKTYIKEKCYTYKGIKYVITRIKKCFSEIKNIDIRSKNTKKIIVILTLNLLVLILISGMWFWGIIVAIVYTIILFVKVKQYSNDVGQKYNKLFQATNEIAAGNLDVTIGEDLGVFEPFKIEVESIQMGLKKALDKEVKSQKMKTELISNVSHDLKTPLTSIITYVDLLKDKNLPDEKRERYLSVLERKSQRLKELIEDLFEVSKATSGDISLNIIDVDVVSLMKQTLLELDDKINKSQLLIRKNFSSPKIILPLDSQRTFRVFENLIINITKYAMKGTRVYIDIQDTDNEVVIVLKNMADVEIDFNVDDIVERFARGDRSRNTEGSGLGLAISKSFVELQGGSFNIEVDGDLFKVIMVFNKNRMIRNKQ
ncbi:Histidine kinase-, DNA gyrase B-, and HSP90-like ATPase [Clostridium collagenovorans DSM 3089]|uniref:histidine kinase n=1 Tax=Clostridium collagenovorans DSM 3089 TaxID=1121306 RepID=A0A1M5XHG5_9CLOT|nr:sensor histidine kinase [Clostridium collagenovorans]SHH99261.1 Histidine kinase-, DNA gyrase B-, and HSP90-like ATPase [Clostridium collagenovorans DSM 3089]